MLYKPTKDNENGVFEIHVTVDCNSSLDWERFRVACAAIGVKAIQILLPEGEYPSHLITGSYHKGSYLEIEELANQITHQLIEKEFTVTRIKIEAMLAHSSCYPMTDREAEQTQEYQYFEFHVKAHVVHPEDIQLLRSICEEFGVHLSRSASSRAKRGNSGELRFITARYRRVGRTTAERKFNDLISRLRQDGFTLSNKLLEWTFYDSNLALDSGWDGRVRAWADESTCAHCTQECPFEEELY